MDSYFTHHVLVVEKSTHRLFLYENDQGYPKLVKSYQIATGKKAGNKLIQGDYKTPEGVYEFLEFLPHKTLVKRHGEQGKIYGVGAFVMDYPNPIDRMKNKSGGGIWLHSTNDETRIEKGLDSRGCVVAGNKDLIDLSQYIELHKTHIVVVDQKNYTDQSSHQTQKLKLEKFLEEWRTSWVDENFRKYISHYHNEHFRDPIRGEIQSFSSYKKRIFSIPGKPEVRLTNIAMLLSGNSAKVTFKQHYKSNTINDVGRKVLYLVKDQNYKWKIIEERWSKLKDHENQDVPPIAFRPSMRFFDSYEVDKTIFKTTQKSNN